MKGEIEIGYLILSSWFSFKNSIYLEDRARHYLQLRNLIDPEYDDFDIGKAILGIASEYRQYYGPREQWPPIEYTIVLRPRKIPVAELAEIKVENWQPLGYIYDLILDKVMAKLVKWESKLTYRGYDVYVVSLGKEGWVPEIYSLAIDLKELNCKVKFSGRLIPVIPYRDFITRQYKFDRDTETPSKTIKEEIELGCAFGTYIAAYLYLQYKLFNELPFPTFQVIINNIDIQDGKRVVIVYANVKLHEGDLENALSHFAVKLMKTAIAKQYLDEKLLQTAVFTDLGLTSGEAT